MLEIGPLACEKVSFVQPSAAREGSRLPAHVSHLAGFITARLIGRMLSPRASLRVEPCSIVLQIQLNRAITPAMLTLLITLDRPSATSMRLCWRRSVHSWSEVCMVTENILAGKLEHAVFIRSPPFEIRPACLRPNMGKCCLATHGKDFSGNAKSTGSVCALTHGVGLWGAFAQARPRRQRQNASYPLSRIPTRSTRSQRWNVLLHSAR